MGYLTQQLVPHWSLNQHEHRQGLNKIMHNATQGVNATNAKPTKPYVTADILEVSAHRAKLIRSKHREEQHANRFVKKRIFAV